MVIKILDLIKVADNRGLEMNQAETVTYFKAPIFIGTDVIILVNISQMKLTIY